MVRQTLYVRNCASEDAEHSNRPRRVTAWFADGSGVCALCRRGLGKNYTREQRKAHEQDAMHTDTHRAYLAAFEECTVARYERLVSEANERKQLVRHDHEQSLLAPANTPALAQWLAVPGNSMALKAGLLDHACRAGPNSKTNSTELRILAEKHVRLAQHLLLLKAVKGVLGLSDDPSRAITVAGLCCTYI
jgi:hypothetical protein